MHHNPRLVRSCDHARLLAICALSSAIAVGCAGSIEGEVDGEGLPPLWSGIWTESELDGDLTQIGVSSTSLLDTCGTMIRRLQAETAAVEAQLDELDDDTDPEDAVDDLNQALDEADATVLPEDFWTVTAVLVVEDTDDLANGSFDQDETGEGAGFVVVCHQEGHPERDELGIDESSTCFVSKETSIDVGGFDPDGGIDLTGEAELVEAEDVEEDVGDVEISLRASACKDLEDAQEDLNDAMEEYFEELFSNPGEGEGEGEGGICSFDEDCFGSRQLCVSGSCDAPELVTATCDAADFLFTSDTEGALVFNSTLESTAAIDCANGFFFDATWFDAEGDFAPTSSDVTGVDQDGSALTIVDVIIEEISTTEGVILISFCAPAFPSSVAFQIDDTSFNNSNPTCATF